jgi:uncharacterized protein YjbK
MRPAVAREEELKYRVPAREDLDRIARALGEPCRVESQRNRYIDTRALDLHGSGILIRLRAFEGSAGAILTVKIAERLEAGFIAAREEEMHLDAPAVDALVAAPAAYLAGVRLPLLAEALARAPGCDLALVAELATWRRLFMVPAGSLALDVVELPGSTEYEVELETGDREAGSAFLEDLFRQRGVAAWKESEPKTGRLFRRLGLVGRGKPPAP